MPGQRTAGLANIALLRRPDDLDEATWLSRWHIDHTPVAIETQSTFGYTQNAVVRALTPGAPVIAAIVEELFPVEAISDLHAFFGAADDDDLRDRMERMVASTAAFGANQNIDTVPTSRYVFRTPFDSNVRDGRCRDDHAGRSGRAGRGRERPRGRVDVARRRHHPGVAGQCRRAAASRRPVSPFWRSSPTAR